MNLINKKKNYKIIFFSLAAIFLLFCGGCASEEIPVMAQATEEPEPSSTVQTAANTLPENGGEFFIAIPKKPDFINPLLTRNRQIQNINTLIYESMIKLGTDGKIEPCLAQSWSVSEDGYIWTFRLREGILWHNGKEFSSNDVIFTLDKISLLKEKNSYFASVNSLIESYSLQDEHTVTINAVSKGMDLLYALNFPILCKDYIDTAEAAEDKLPMGTGPYKVENYEKETEMKLSVFENWWRKLPYITNITAVAMETHDDELPAYQTGLLDFVATPLLTAQQYRQYGTTNVSDYTTQYYDCIITNNQGVMSDLKLRQAVAYAIDKGDIISKEMMFHAVACDVMLPPDSWLYDGKYKLYEYNISKAKELINSAGYIDTNGDGVLEKSSGGVSMSFNLNLLVLEGDDTLYLSYVAKNIKTQLELVGLNVEIKELKWEEYFSALENKEFDIALTSYYLSRNPLPSFVVASEGKGNFGGYSSERMDNIIVDLKEKTSEVEIKEAYNNYSQIFIDELPHIPLFFRTNSVIYDNSIKGIKNLREDAVFEGISEWYLLVRNT